MGSRRATVRRSAAPRTAWLAATAVVVGLSGCATHAEIQPGAPEPTVFSVGAADDYAYDVDNPAKAAHAAALALLEALGMPVEVRIGAAVGEASTSMTR